MGGPRVALISLLVGLAGSASLARADSLTIDPAQSEVTVTGTVTFDLANGPLVGAGTSQGSGSTLPSGLQSDGRTTFLQGVIEYELTPTTIHFRSAGSAVAVGNSGSFLPGVPGSSAMAAPANAAFAFSDPTFGMTGNVSVRDLRFTLTSVTLPLTETGTGSNVFEFPASVFGQVTGGARDLETNFVANIARMQLVSPLTPPMPAVGTLELPPGGDPRLTIPLSVTNLLLGRDVLATEVTASLDGQIVATGPEPSGALLGLVALGALAVLRRRSQRP